MAKRLQYRRLLILALILAAAFAGLGYRLVDLQVLRHEELGAIAQQNTQREFLFIPRRGDILDAKGNILATSTFVKMICADPTLIGNRQPEIARAVAPLLQMTEADLCLRLSPRVWKNDKGEMVTNQFIRLKAKVPVETWQKIQTAMQQLSFGLEEKKLPSAERTFYRVLREKAIFAQDYPLRSYPNHALAAHILGFAGTEERKLDDHLIHEIDGREGIERMLNSKLGGVPGWRRTETDRRGREMVALREEDVGPRDGLNVVLTIDAVIQHILESVLAEAMEKHTPVSASGLIIRPRTGEILAMATLPNFDPNNPGAASADSRRNRIIADVMEPGSTFKIVVVSGALNDQTVRLADAFDCERGHFSFAGRVLHDHESYGPLSVESIITKSSNIGAAKIGIRMGQNRLYDYITRFGFGDRTGLPLPGEVRGLVHPVKSWSKVSVAQIPMGHGIAITRIQIAMAMCAIANNGWLMRPMLVDRLEDQSGATVVKYAPQRVRQVISDSAAKSMVTALKTVVSAEGTAPKAALEHYTVAGKTGTAQKVEPTGGYSHDKFISSFIGFFPADNPELCISIVIDDPKEGHYGGTVAGPLFKQIAERVASYANIRPDIEVRTAAMPNVAGLQARARREFPRKQKIEMSVKLTAMEPRPMKFIVQACAGEQLRGSPDSSVSRVCTDSRAVQAGDLFIALTGEHFDGHEFLADVTKKGAAALMVKRRKRVPEEPAACAVIVVEDTRKALGKLAAEYRKGFSLPIVAVGGSNGKTTTKELIASVLRQKLATLWSEASFNNDIGVPVTLLRLEKSHEAAVLEVGTNHPGELAPLVAMIQPKYGVITNIGREHLEFFGDLAGVAAEEGALAGLLPPDGKLFINGDSEWTQKISERTIAAVVRIGLGERNHWRATDVRPDETGVTFQVKAPDEKFAGEYRINLLGRHQVVNALFAIAVGGELGLARAQIERGLAGCRPARMRLQLWEFNGVRVLDDAYNANADSTVAALQTLQDLPCKGPRIAVLGDMAELGAHSEAAHAEVGRRAAELGIGQLFVVGRMASVMARAAREAGLTRVLEFFDVESAAAAVKQFVRSGDVLLLKASRAARLERISELLRISEAAKKN